MEGSPRSATSTLPAIAGDGFGQAGMASTAGFSEMVPSDSSLTPHYASVVHFAWQERQKFILAHEAEYRYHLDCIARAQDKESATIRAKAFLAEMDLEGRRVFLNAYHASIHQLEGESPWLTTSPLPRTSSPAS